MAAALFFLTFPHAKVSQLDGFSDEEMKPELYFFLAPQGKRCVIQAS